MAGAYPGSMKDQPVNIAYETMHVLLDEGIDTFVCLEPDLEIRQRAHPRPYMTIAQELLTENHGKVQGYPKLPVRIFKFPFQDGGCVPCDLKLYEWIAALLDCINKGSKLYVHCWAGRGRTGIFVAILLGVLYQLNAEESMKRIQIYFDCRLFHSGKTPERPSQRKQVSRYLAQYQEALAAGNNVLSNKENSLQLGNKQLEDGMSKCVISQQSVQICAGSFSTTLQYVNANKPVRNGNGKSKPKPKPKPPTLQLGATTTVRQPPQHGMKVVFPRTFSESPNGAALLPRAPFDSPNATFPIAAYVFPSSSLLTPSPPQTAPPVTMSATLSAPFSKQAFGMSLTPRAPRVSQMKQNTANRTPRNNVTHTNQHNRLKKDDLGKKPVPNFSRTQTIGRLGSFNGTTHNGTHSPAGLCPTPPAS